MSLGLLMVERNIINEKPPYQRESGIWSVEKQQLFIDSLINRFDVPKIYLHDLRGSKGRHDYAIIDGKQRLDTVWRFMEDGFGLAPDFKVMDTEARSPIKGGSKFSQFDIRSRELFKATSLDVVLVSDASEDEIEELFSRLNNGEQLTSAEKRNAMGGDMTALIREVAKSPFFRLYVSFANKRYEHLEVAAKLLLVEESVMRGGDPVCDLKKKFLDSMVERNDTMSEADKLNLSTKIKAGLRLMTRVFVKHDPLLRKQAYPPIYYLFVKFVFDNYGHADLMPRIHKFLGWFESERVKNLARPEEERDSYLVEYGRLIQQGTNDKSSLETRRSYLVRFFLKQNPEVIVRDRKRAFSDDERYAIWELGNRRCAECTRALPSLADMDADHEMSWAHGGPTTIANARSLCAGCNRKPKERAS